MKYTRIILLALLILFLSVTAMGLAYANPAVYVTNSQNNNVTVADGGSNTYTTSVNTALTPYYSLLNPAGTSLLVSDYGAGVVQVLSSASYLQTASITTNGNPDRIVITNNGQTAYVTNPGAPGFNTVDVLNLGTDTLTTTITVGSTPEGICLVPGGAYVYVANNVANTVSAISTSTNTVIATISVNSGPTGIVASPNGQYVYVATSSSVQEIQVSSNTVVGTWSLSGAGCNDIGILPSGSEIYVAGQTSSTLYAINVPTFSTAANITITHVSAVGVASTGYVYAAGYNSGTLSVINSNTNTIVGTIGIGTVVYGVSSGSLAPENGQSTPTMVSILFNMNSQPVQGVSASVFNSAGNLLQSNTSDSTGTDGFSLLPSSSYMVNWSYGSLLPGSGYSTPNLLTANEATVESGTTGFTPRSNVVISQSNTYAWQGSYSLKAVVAASTYNGVYINNIPVTPGLTYTASDYITGLSTNTYNNAVSLILYWYYANSTLESQVGSGAFTATTNGAFTRTLLTGVAPAGASFVDILYLINAASYNAGDTFWMDGFAFEQSSQADPWGWPTMYSSNYVAPYYQYNGSFQIQPSSSTVYYVNMLSGQVISQTQQQQNPPVVFTIHVTSLYGVQTWVNVNVSVYASGVLPITGQTDSNGIVVFTLTPNIYYTAWANSSSQHINQTITIYPTSTNNQATIDVSILSWLYGTTNPWLSGISGLVSSGSGNPGRDILATVSTSNNGATYYINSTYNDSSIATTAVNFSVYQYNSTNMTLSPSLVQTQLFTPSPAAGIQNATFSLSNAAGHSYLLIVTGSNTYYGNVEYQYDITFNGVLVQLPILGPVSPYYAWIAFIISVLIAYTATRFSVHIFGIAICGWLWIAFGMGWLGTIGSSVGIAGSLTFSTVIAVLYFLSYRRKTEGYS